MRILRQRSEFASVLFAFAAGILMLGTTPASARRVVSISPDYPAGEIIINAHQRALYFTEGDGRAIRYPVAVGKPGKVWFGHAEVEGKFIKPSWSPPAVVAHDHPELPDFIPGGSPHNPMGAAAITLSRDEVAIHGTTRRMRHSIGTAASYGCIRMYNEDIRDLFKRVSIGTPVVAIP